MQRKAITRLSLPLQNQTAVLLAFAVLLFSACADSASRPEKPAEPTTTAVSTADVKQKIKIKTPDEKPVAEIDLTGNDPKVDFSLNGQTGILRGTSNAKGKRKYEAEDFRIIAEIKAAADSFKLKAMDGRLLWKVKWVDSKIKIANNEEMNSAFVLKPGEPDRVKALREDAEIGKVKFYRERGKVKIETAADVLQYESNTNIFSGAYGVLLMNDIPTAERLLILTELLARGR